MILEVRMLSFQLEDFKNTIFKGNECFGKNRRADSDSEWRIMVVVCSCKLGPCVPVKMMFEWISDDVIKIAHPDV
jgi:hypothetical protein